MEPRKFVYFPASTTYAPVISFVLVVISGRLPWWSVNNISKAVDNFFPELNLFFLFHESGNLFKGQNSFGILLILTKFFMCIISIQLFELI